MDSITASCSSSSSSSTTHDHQSWTYDVFLSFRGADTRNNFVGHLHANLVRKGIKTFIDDAELERGDEISNALVRAIQESKISVIVFSENYASSRWCLEELVKILHCKESKQQLVYPVFYKVDPADVRHQRGSFGQALAHHGSRLTHNLEKVERWREALTKASNLSGWHFIDGSHESKFIDTIVEGISAELLDRIHLSVAKYPVGIQSRVEDVLKHLCVGQYDVRKLRMVGIWGIGGIGKTTIAKGVYNSIAHNFEGSCFLENVRERSIAYRGLVELQKALLFKILKEKDLRITSVDEGITLIKQRLCHKKVLLILDDVNHINQLDKLVGKSDWFGSGSRIIITTRDKRWLTDVDHIYNLKELSHHEALELFKSNAFKENQKKDDYDHLIDNITLYAQGLPLALEVLGSYLRGKNVDQWKVALDGYAREPKKEIQEILRTSYDALDDLTKEIFLHIACFFKGQAKNYVMDILRGCDLNPEYGIEVLAEKALIEINEENGVVMHDLLEEMGKEIVRQESPTEPGERSRLWQYEDVYRVFMENTGSAKVRGIMVKSMNDRDEKIHLNSESFSKMKNLQIFVSPYAVFTGDHVNYLPNDLRLLDWAWCPLLSSFPPSFYPKKLVVLKMSVCQTSPLGEVPKTMQNLKYIDMSYCHGVRKISGLSMYPNLVNLDLSFCINLVEVEVRSKNLVELNLLGCQKLEKFEIVEEMRSLKILNLGWTGIKEFPSSIRYLINLEELRLMKCNKLTTVPSSILELQHLKHLDLSHCYNLVRFPAKCETRTTKLRYDSLFIDLEACRNLVEILELPREINGLYTRACESLRKISSLSNIVEGKESKMIPQLELDSTLCGNVANEYLAKLKRENILPRDNSEITALLSLFLSCWQSSFLVCFPAATAIPQWFTCRTSSQLEGKDRDTGIEVYKLKIEIPATVKLWESKGGLAFRVHPINYHILSFRLRTIDINGVRIIRALAGDRHYRRNPCGYVWLHYIPFDTIIRRLREAGIGLLPNTFLVNVEFDYDLFGSSNTVKCSCGVHVVIPEFEEDGGISVTCA